MIAKLQAGCLNAGVFACFPFWVVLHVCASASLAIMFCRRCLRPEGQLLNVVSQPQFRINVQDATGLAVGRGSRCPSEPESGSVHSLGVFLVVLFVVYVCMYVCTYVCTYVRMYVGKYVHIYIYIYTHIHIYI